MWRPLLLGAGLVLWIGACADGEPAVDSLDEPLPSRVDARDDASVLSDAPADAAPLPYPTRTGYRIKALQPDFWSPDDIAANNVGGVALDLVWSTWEPTQKAPPCDAPKEAEYDGHCFVVDAAVDAAIGDWTARGVVVTSVVYGVPAWARTTRRCSPAVAGHDIFCAPDSGADYGRFAGMLAQRFDGNHQHGRIADFVIHDEVNSNDRFDIGCGQGTACDPNTRIDVYADSYNAAYDRVAVEQPMAKVFVSLENHFLGPGLDAPGAASPLLSGTTFLTRFAMKATPRAWRVALHPYPSDRLAPVFSPDDRPLVTFGNLGTIAGWLRKTYPDLPSTWDIELSESGLNSLAPKGTEAAQAAGVCDSLRNALGTPGISNYVYHRMKDDPGEAAKGLGFGLRDGSGKAKQAWTVWALANRNDLLPPQLSCGFEDLPYTRLKRSYLASRGHWTSSRIAPLGFSVEAAWRLFRDESPGTVLLYECRAGMVNLVTKAPDCESLEPLGPLGYAYAKPTDGAVALYRCSIPATGDHFTSGDANCEGQSVDDLLGYVLPP